MAKFFEEVQLNQETVEWLEERYPDKKERDKFVDQALADKLSETDQ